MAVEGSKLPNLVRLTAGQAPRMSAAWLCEPNQVRSLNLVREFRSATNVGALHSETTSRFASPNLGEKSRPAGAHPQPNPQAGRRKHVSGATPTGRLSDTLGGADLSARRASGLNVTRWPGGSSTRFRQPSSSC